MIYLNNSQVKKQTNVKREDQDRKKERQGNSKQPEAEDKSHMGGIIVKWVDQRALNLEKKRRNKLTQRKHTGSKQIITVKKRNQKKSNTVTCVTCLTILVLQLEVSRAGLI